MRSKKYEIVAIAAVGKDTRAIGKNNGLLWRISGDLPRFKKLTLGHPIIMGYKTYKSIGRALPNRTNIVLTRRHNNSKFDSGVRLANTLKQALDIAKKAEGAEKIFVIGGGQIYKLMLPYTDTLELTIIEDDSKGDTYFPKYEDKFDKVISSKDNHNYNGVKYSFVKLRRK